MSYKQEVTELLEQKIDWLKIYINIFNSANNNEIIDSEENIAKTEYYINKCELYLELLTKFKNYIINDYINENFLIYIKSIISHIGFVYSSNVSHFENLNLQKSSTYYFNIINKVNNETILKLEQLNFDINTIEKFYFYKSNLVFVGANGAGKTTFANDLRKHFWKVCVGISAQRVLKIGNNNSILNILDTRNQLQAIQLKDISNKNGSDISNEFTILLNNLFSENTVTANTLKTQFLNGQNPEAIKSILDNIIEVWNELITHRTLKTDWMNLSLYADNIPEYTANFMSDGEKVILYIVWQVLTSPKDGFIIIDEPEIFLNKNILNKLWNKLEILRDDCKFIYITHDLDFALSRQTSYKYWIKSYIKDNFDFSEIENNEIPERLTMELLGSQKNILFCEGKNDGKSYDIRILSILFPQFNIKAVESCTNVINYTKTFNNMNNVWIKAFGLIDSDFHPQERLNSLEEENIYNFWFSEIENICLNESLFINFAKDISSSDDSFEIMKTKVISELNTQKIEQASLYVTMKIDYHYKESHMNKGKTLEELNNNFTNFNEPIEIDNWYNSRITEIESIISSENYIEAIKIFNNKWLIAKANQSLDIKNYMERIIKYLSKTDTNLDDLRGYFHANLNTYS